MTQKYFIGLAVLLTLLVPSGIFSQVITIAEARALGAGASVTVRGIVTNGSELGKIRYLQDGTAGIAAFPGNGSVTGFDTTVKLGDSIEVTGTLIQFQSLLEISPITAFSVISSGNTVPTPKIISLLDVNESIESQLVQVECVSFEDGGGIFSSTGLYNVKDSDGNIAKVYLRGGHPLLTTTIPEGGVALTCIISQFGDYQLLPRSSADFTAAQCFYFNEKFSQSNISTNGFTLNWGTNLTGSTVLRYGATPALGQELSAAGANNQHTISLSGLQAGNIYWVQAVSTHNTETIQSDIVPFATKSLSSGKIEVYFTHDVDEQFLAGQAPSGTSPEAIVATIISRIDAAKQTIDVSMYNNNRSDLTDALIAAHNRGVRVRYVAALGAGSPALEPNVPFPVVYGNNIALMHNKFLVIDADDTNNCWVMSGSTNWTTSMIYDDYNNVVFIQDQSLARTYELEFEEMWGSNGAQPDPLNQRFGSLKRDNTPHHFIIGDTPVESWFSPSDGVTDQIVRTIYSANATADFALFTFTKNEPGDALAWIHQNGNVAVQGMIENVNDNGSEYTFLLGQGVPVAAHSYSNILHHKYIVVDAMQPVSDPQVLTGSHNWSQTAESQNDENTLIIHDLDVARMYKAEFERRTDENPIATHEPLVGAFKLFPNPATAAFSVQATDFQIELSKARLEIWSITGQCMKKADLSQSAVIRVEDLPDGAYLVKIIAPNGFGAVPFQKISR